MKINVPSRGHLGVSTIRTAVRWISAASLTSHNTFLRVQSRTTAQKCAEQTHTRSNFKACRVAAMPVGVPRTCARDRVLVPPDSLLTLFRPRSGT